MKLPRAFRYTIVFICILVGIVLVAEIGGRNTVFSKSGDFLILVFYATIVSGVFTLLLNGYDDSDNEKDSCRRL